MVRTSIRGGDGPAGGRRSPWAWIPTLYFAQGLPYVAVNAVALVMFKRLGLSNAEIALYTSWLNFPWVIKPLWSPVVDLFKTKRFWIVAMQLIVGGGLAGVALTIPSGDFVRYTLAFFWLLAFSSATHDIAADGFYMLDLEPHEQAKFVGVRSTFFRLAMITGQGLVVMLAGALETRLAPDGALPGIQLAWATVFLGLAGVFLVFCAWHWSMLPRPASDQPARGSARGVLSEFAETFVSFFRKPGIVMGLAFILLYRLAEAQLVRLAQPFLLDARESGGLALATSQVGLIYGTFGVVALLLGGILGGILVSRRGLKHWLPAMVCAINVPNAVYLYLAYAQPESVAFIGACVVIEQFGYGFGFAAFMLFMIYVAQGPRKTAHYSICTGFMALGMMLPGMISGWLQESLGYQHFFIWILAATLPSFGVAALVYGRIDPAFARKEP